MKAQAIWCFPLKEKYILYRRLLDRPTTCWRWLFCHSFFYYLLPLFEPLCVLFPSWRDFPWQFWLHGWFYLSLWLCFLPLCLCWSLNTNSYIFWESRLGRELSAQATRNLAHSWNYFFLIYLFHLDLVLRSSNIKKSNLDLHFPFPHVLVMYFCVYMSLKYSVFISLVKCQLISSIYIFTFRPALLFLFFRNIMWSLS